MRPDWRVRQRVPSDRHVRRRDRHRRLNIGRRFERIHAPRRGGRLAPADGEQPRRPIGRERHVEFLERVRQAVAHRLDERFLAGPSLEEPAASIRHRQRVVLALFRRRETLAHQLRHVVGRAYAFDVDANRRPPRHADETEALGVREVELQARRRVHQLRLAARRLPKPQPGRVQVAGRRQHPPQDAVRHHVGPAIAIEGEASGAHPLTRRQQPVHAAQRLRTGVQRHHARVRDTINERHWDPAA